MGTVLWWTLGAGSPRVRARRASHGARHAERQSAARAAARAAYDVDRTKLKMLGWLDGLPGVIPPDLSLPRWCADCCMEQQEGNFVYKQGQDKHSELRRRCVYCDGEV